jgi:hypothetical protein
MCLCGRNPQGRHPRGSFHRGNSGVVNWDLEDRGNSHWTSVPHLDYNECTESYAVPTAVSKLPTSLTALGGKEVR